MKHKCCNCEEQISLYRAFCSKDCKLEFESRHGILTKRTIKLIKKEVKDHDD